MVLPHVPVASADTTVRFRLDDGIARPGLRVRKVCTSSGFPNSVITAPRIVFLLYLARRDDRGVRVRM